MKKCLLLAVLFAVSFIVHASPLPAEEVFQVSAEKLDPNTLAIHWQIKPGYFLYADRIKVKQMADSNVHLGKLRLPSPLMKSDKLGQSYGVYRNNLSLPVASLGEHPGESFIQLGFQGCSDKGFCYPPQVRNIKLTIDKQLALTQVAMEKTANQELANPPPTKANGIQTLFVSHHWIIVILSFFGFGLLLAFTPCILPMIPVLSGIIVHGKDLSTRRAFFLSLSYVLSMALTYAVVGALVALLGYNLQIIMQSPWIIGLFSFLFVLLAVSMFGFFNLRLPVSWQSKLAKINQSHANGHYLGAALMGCFSTLILSPCVTPPLIGALGYIAQTNDIVLGSLALFALGLGMGAPLLLIGTSAGKWLPKAGYWMNGVKAFFGILLLGVAIYLLSRILPGLIVMLLWSSLLIFTGTYCQAFSKAQSNLAKFRQGFGLISLVYGLLILVGASMGNTNPLQPLARALPSPSIQQIETLNTVSEVQQALANAKGKPVLVDFYADWCIACKIMEATTFKNPQVQALLKNFVVLKVDVTANNEENKAILKKFGVIAPPTFLFFDKQGSEQPSLRLVGETTASKFLEQLKVLIGGQNEG